MVLGGGIVLLILMRLVRFTISKIGEIQRSVTKYTMYSGCTYAAYKHDFRER